MTTLILAAGQGTRLRPYTNDRPKCMVALRDKPILHRQIDVLNQYGLGQNLVLVGGYLADKLDAPTARVVLNPRYASTNMVTTLFCARADMQPGEDLLISYGDIVYEPGVLEQVLNCDAPLCIAADQDWRRLWQLRMDDPLSDAETFRMDGQENVLELGKKPDSYDDVQAQYLGLIKVRGDKVAEFIAAYDTLDRAGSFDGKDFDNMYMTSFLQHLIDSGWQARACLVSNGWLEVDTAEELEIYDRMARDGTLDSYCKLA